MNDALAAITKGTIKVFEDYTHIEEAMAVNYKADDALEKLAH